MKFSDSLEEQRATDRVNRSNLKHKDNMKLELLALRSLYTTELLIQNIELFPNQTPTYIFIEHVLIYVRMCVYHVDHRQNYGVGNMYVCKYVCTYACLCTHLPLCTLHCIF